VEGREEVLIWLRPIFVIPSGVDMRCRVEDASGGLVSVEVRAVQTSGTFPALSTPPRKPKKRGSR
jgi:hypothetical protein